MSTSSYSKRISYSKAKLLVNAIAIIVDGDGEYEAGDSFARIAEVDANIALRVHDPSNDIHLEVFVNGTPHFQAIAKTPCDFEIELFINSDWIDAVIQHAKTIVPSQNWTFGSSPEEEDLF